MDQFLVYGRIHFLRELGQGNKTTRKLLVRYITREQMEALAEVAGYIVRGSIRVLPQYATQFREQSLILRQVIDPRISLRRKRNSGEVSQHFAPSVETALPESSRRLIDSVRRAIIRGTVHPTDKMIIEEFYLYLYCGDSLSTHVNNHAGDFVVDLPKTYLLEGRWDCALTELTLHPQTKQRAKRLYLCSDLVQDSYLKNTFLPVLRSVDQTQEGTLDLEFGRPYYTRICVRWS